MKLEEKDIKKTIKLVEKLVQEDMITGVGRIFIPIKDSESTTTEYNIVLTEKPKYGMQSMVQSGLVINQDGTVGLAYVSTEYSINFDFKSFVQRLKSFEGSFPLKDKEVKTLSDIEWLIVKEQSILLKIKAYL